MVVKLSVEAQDIAKMRYSTFRQQILFKKYGIMHSFATKINLGTQQVERLAPRQNKKGAIFTFIIDCNISDFDDVVGSLTESVRNSSLAQEFSRVYKINGTVAIPIDSLSFTKLQEIERVATQVEMELKTMSLE